MEAKILVVEDHPSVQTAIKFFLKKKDPGFKVLEALDLDSAKALFYQNKNSIDAIVMDFELGDNVDTADLAKEFRKIFDGPMIANSSSQGHNIVLMNSGCDYLTPGKLEYPSLADMIVELVKERRNKAQT